MTSPRTIEKTTYTGAAAVAVVGTPPGGSLPGKGTAWELLSVMLKYSADPGVENLTITYNSSAGAVYDMLLKAQAMSGVTALWWTPTERLYIAPGDSVDIAQTNASTRTYGITLTWGEVVV